MKKKPKAQPRTIMVKFTETDLYNLYKALNGLQHGVVVRMGLVGATYSVGNGWEEHAKSMREKNNGKAKT